MRVIALLFCLISFCTFADTTNWMSQIPNDRPFNQLMIPGTHDSGTYNIQPESQFSLSPDDPLPTWFEQISNILPLSIVRPVVAGWSKTQPLTISQQLNAGIRYLDFRAGIFPTDGQFYLSHALLSVKLEEALKQIQQFSAANPSEVVILDINHLFNVTTESQETELLLLLKNYLGQFAIPNSFHTTDTIGTLRAHGNVIIIMDINQPYSPALTTFATESIWHESAINSVWPNVTTIPALKSALDSEMAAREKTPDDTRFFVLQGILTEGANEIINGIINPTQYPNNIQRYAAPLNTQLYSWIGQYKNLNIVIQDWFDSSSQLVPLAEEYDSQPRPLKNATDIQPQLDVLKEWYSNKNGFQK